MAMDPIAGIPWTAVCLDCEYPLRGLGHHACPECGRHFSPKDHNTYRRLGVMTYTRKLYRGEFVVAAFVILFIAFLMLGIAGLFIN